MIVNLENVSYMTVSGTRVELHFKDSSSYMNRFGSVGEMLAAMQGWQEKTRILHGECLRSDIEEIAGKRKTSRAKKLSIAASRP
jgi:hypothetical protein